jgi:hypothetical protein
VSSRREGGKKGDRGEWKNMEEERAERQEVARAGDRNQRGRKVEERDTETDLITNSIGVDPIKGDDRTIVFMNMLPPSETCRRGQGERASERRQFGGGGRERRD